MKVKYLLTVKKIPDALWNEARLLITPSEKSNNFIGRPAAVVSLGRYSMALYMFSECLMNWRQCQWKIIDVAQGVCGADPMSYRLSLIHI